MNSSTKEHHCFICLEQKRSPPPPLGMGDPGTVTSSGDPLLYSLNSLFRCLKMKGKFPHPGEEQGSSVGLGVELCDDCAPVMKDFSGLYRQLEKVEMEVTSQLGRIHEKMLKAAEGLCAGKGIEQLREQPSPQGGIRKRLESLGKLRDEVVQKCYLKLDTDLPRVPLKKLTWKQVRKLKTNPGSDPKLASQTFDVGNDRRMGPGDMEIEAFEDAIDSGVVKLEVDHVLDGDGEDEDLGNSSDSKANLYSTVYLPDHSDPAKEPAMNGFNKGSPASISREGSPPLGLVSRKTGRAKCTLCSKMFKNKYIFQTHYRDLHLNQGVKRHTCQECGKAFIQLGGLQVHLKTVHSQVRQYPCQVCRKRFKTKGALSNHHDRIHIKGGRQGRRSKGQANAATLMEVEMIKEEQ